MTNDIGGIHMSVIFGYGKDKDTRWFDDEYSSEEFASKSLIDRGNWYWRSSKWYGGYLGQKT